MNMQLKNLSETDQAIMKLLDLSEELITLRKYDDAERFLGEIEKYKPDDLNVPFLRGLLFKQKNENKKAIEQFEIVYKNKPKFFANLNNIGACYYNLQQYETAIEFYKKCLEIAPDADLVLMMLGVCLVRHGKLDEAISYFKAALDKTPDLIETHSSLLMAMMYSENVSPEQLAEESKKYGEKVSRLLTETPVFKNDLEQNRKLKIGYVSQDFKDHPIPYFLDPLLVNHNRDDFIVYAYSTTPHDNPVMERMKSHVDVWRDIYQLDDKKACDLIREDMIDILIDVGGHTGFNNLKTFARRAAPIQIEWLGYPATTGMSAFDYKISDPYVEPVGMCEHLNSEEIWRLPNIFCCYQPHENSPSVIDHPPFEDNGYITFGCFNNFIKVRDPVIEAWGKILKQVPDSKLLLEIYAIEDRPYLELIEKRLTDNGCPLDRITIEPRKKENQYNLYNKIDIALDPFPCTGGTTTMDTLWMGVPLVTLEGRQFASRMSSSFLSNINLSELIATDIDQYVDIATTLATDKVQLKEMRNNLRERFASSPAMDQRAFAKDMENAYRSMWKKYCKKS